MPLPLPVLPRAPMPSGPRAPMYDLDDRPHEECGVVAVSGVANAAELAFLALYALQHRGQEAAGIVAIGKDGISRAHKGAGLVSEVFDVATLARLDGSTAIGHVRYSTAGGSSVENVQPITARYFRGDMALAHNGNLTNQRDLRNRLVEEGAIFRTTSDSEILVHLIAKSRHDTVDAQIDDALTHLEGAYSLVLSVDDTVYAVRDPRGFRPLVLGKLDGGHVVTSETCALDILGAEYIRDVEPGEVLKIQGRRCRTLRSLPRRGPAGAVHLRARLLRAPRLAHLGAERGPGAQGVRPAPRAGAPGGGRRRHRGAGQRQLRGARLRRGERHPLRARARCGTTTWVAPSSSRRRRTATSARA